MPMVKTQKSKLLQKLTLQPIDVQSYTALVDMGMIWRLASPTAEDKEKGDGSPYTWGDYTNKIASMILARHVHAILPSSASMIPTTTPSPSKMMSVSYASRVKVISPMSS